MATPFSLLPGAVPVPSVWRAILGLRFFRRLLGIRREHPAPSSSAHALGRLGTSTFDWDGPDTSLTQAELEVLK
jgi:hypothetical protein